MPSWSAIAPVRPVRTGEIAAIVLRHCVPIVGILAFGWSAVQFLLLTVFNFGLTIGNIGLVGVSVETLRESADRRVGVGQWINLLIVTAIIALLLTALGGWPMFVIAHRDENVLAEPALWLSALMMELAAIPVIRADIRAKLASTQSLEEMKLRDQPRVGAAFFGIGASLILSGWAANWGRFGMLALVIVFTAFGLLRELRPDVIHAALRPVGSRY